MTINVFLKYYTVPVGKYLLRFEDYSAFIFRVKPFKRALFSLLDLFYPEDEGNRIFHTLSAVYSRT